MNKNQRNFLIFFGIVGLLYPIVLQSGKAGYISSWSLSGISLIAALINTLRKFKK